MDNYTGSIHKRFLTYLQEKGYLKAESKTQFEKGISMVYGEKDIVRGDLADYLSLTKAQQEELNVKVYETKASENDVPSQEVQTIVENYTTKMEKAVAYHKEAIQPYVGLLVKDMKLADNVNVKAVTEYLQGKQRVIFEFTPQLSKEDYKKIVGLDKDNEQYVKNKSYMSEKIHGEPISLYLARYRDKIFDTLFALKKPTNGVQVQHDYRVATRWNEINNQTEREKGVGAMNSDVYYRITYEFDAVHFTEEDCVELFNHILPSINESIV